MYCLWVRFKGKWILSYMSFIPFKTASVAITITKSQALLSSYLTELLRRKYCQQQKRNTIFLQMFLQET